MRWCFCHVKQIRKNKLIYQDKPRLKTALEMLRISMYIEDSLSQVNSFADDVVQNKKNCYGKACRSHDAKRWL